VFGSVWPGGGVVGAVVCGLVLGVPVLGVVVSVVSACSLCVCCLLCVVVVSVGWGSCFFLFVVFLGVVLVCGCSVWLGSCAFGAYSGPVCVVCLSSGGFSVRFSRRILLKRTGGPLWCAVLVRCAIVGARWP
jgi:hypothetical protein